MRIARFALSCALSLSVVLPAHAALLLTARVAQGALAGRKVGSVAAFLGVPYAAPPTGANRWRAPRPAVRWQGVRDAKKFAPSCYQAVVPSYGPWTREYSVSGKVSEDCLYLNIWTPAHRAGPHLPVLFWIYGGGFAIGSGSVPIYDGAALAAQGIVVVNVNYRLGAFGFLALPALTTESRTHTSGNYGLLDQIAALKWVRDNIAAFGGNPAAVTIDGQSAGAVSVIDLSVSPLARGLYTRAIAESGAGIGLAMPSLTQAERYGLGFVNRRGASSLAALRALPANKLLINPFTEGLNFEPIVDGYVLPAPVAVLMRGGRINDTPFLTGLNADEGSGTDPTYGRLTSQGCRSYISMISGTMAATFRRLYLPATGNCNEGVETLIRDRGLVSTENWARLRAATAKAPIYLYFWDHVEPGPQASRYGAFHSSEIPYVFGTLDKAPDRHFTDADQTISVTMSRYWLDFVRGGNPNGTALARWPAYGASSVVMELGDHFGICPDISSARRRALEEYVARGGKLGLFTMPN